MIELKSCIQIEKCKLQLCIIFIMHAFLYNGIRLGYA